MQNRQIPVSVENFLFGKLNDRLDIRIVRHIALKDAHMWRKSVHEVFYPVEEKMAHGDIGRSMSGNGIVKTTFDRHSP